MAASVTDPNVVITPPIDLPVPPVPAVPWFDGEHWHWAVYTSEGNVLTCTANGQFVFAVPGVVGAKGSNE